MGTSIQPTALYQFTGYQLKEFAEHIVKETLKNELQKVPKPERICSRQAKQMLAEKGFRVRSDTTMTNITKRYNLTRERKGNEFWYLTEQIESIPSKISQ